ncbi:MAG: hypothetical protein H7Y13_02320 [Sphingobacteriaceae bacterium]|nr:hypothetical protein [Sphingobacteriaceae bacterium]
MKQIQQYKALIISAALFIAILAFVYLKGKKAGKILIPDAPYIHGKEGLPKGFNPNILADKLYEVMSGFFTMSGYKDEAWKQLIDLSTDDMVIAVYNAFNDKYGNKGKGSLTQWISDEYYYDFVTNYKNKAVNRLKSLRLN